jgi:predicted glycoside hydrolase/deacetylase ChbG (UPF0249 family)
MPLITRADDFGSSPGANSAILDAIDAGFVRNVGLMAPAPFFTHRIDELRERQQDLCLGLHATLTSEWPRFPWGPLLTEEQVPGLTLPDGRFPPDSQALGQRATVPEMMAELSAQLERVRQEGFFPQYLDCHMGFSWLPGVEAALQRLCDQENLVFANHASYVSLPILLSGDNDPTLEEIAAALEGVAEQRHREALRLAQPAKLLEILHALNLLPATYAEITPIRGCALG